MFATTTPGPAAPTDLTVDTTSQPTAAPHPVDTIENLVVRKDDAPPRKKPSQRPAYLNYDEEVFKQKLQLLVDPSGWAAGYEDVNKQMVSIYIVISLLSRRSHFS